MLDRLPFLKDLRAARRLRKGRGRHFRRHGRGLKKSMLVDQKFRHRLEREQFEMVLSTMRATMIDDRIKVLDAFLSTEKHLTITEIAGIVAEVDSTLCDRDFLVETMDLFCACGFAFRRDFEGRETTYEHQHLGQHHDHLICTGCGRIEEFISPEIEEEQVAMAACYGFHPLQHRMEIYGLCEECMAKRAPKQGLAMAAVGEMVRVCGYAVACPDAARQRLVAMGLVSGTDIEVLSSSTGGPVIVAAGESRLALDGELAANLLVRHCCRYR